MSNLGDLRQQIDKADKKLLKVLAERFTLTKKVGEYKKKQGLKPQDKKREKEIFKKREEWADVLGLDPALVKRLFKLIIKKVRENHKKV